MAFPFFCPFESIFDCRKFLHQIESRKKIDYGVNDEPLDAKLIGAEPCCHGTDGKACIAPDRKNPHRLAFLGA